MKKSFVSLVAATCALFSAPSTAKAVVLDWNSVTWADGSLINEYDIDPSFAGTDIRVAVSGDIGVLFLNNPRLSTDLSGGNNPASNALILNTNHSNLSTSVTVTIDFYNPAGVLNPTFSLFDIDTGLSTPDGFTWQDQISDIQASFGGTLYNATFTNLGSAVVNNGGVLDSTANVDNSSGDGNATLSFTGGPVTRIQFTYSTGSASIANPDGQVIGVGNISFNEVAAVPEINSLWVVLGALVLAASIKTLRQKKISYSDLVPTV